MLLENLERLSMEGKKGLKNSVCLLMLMSGSETWMWSRAQQSRLWAVERSYLRGACGITRRDAESNGGVYEKCSIGMCANGIKYGVVE